VSVIIFEDLHWLDEPSHGFVKTMVEAEWHQGRHGVELSAAVVVACSVLPHYRELPLQELDRGDIGRLVHDLVGDDPALEKLAGRSPGRAAHHFRRGDCPPLAQSGVLTTRTVSSGAVGLAATGPAGHGRSGDQRASRCLPERDKTVLQTCAVIGKVSSRPGARGRQQRNQSEELFTRLCDMELIRRARRYMNSFTFATADQEVAYAMQLRTRHAGLHAAVAKSIEGLPGAAR
jgi:hypothetical protein